MKCPENSSHKPKAVFAEWKKVGGGLCPGCAEVLRKRMKVSPKVQSTNSGSKTFENKVSRFLFGRLRDWTERHDISDGVDGKYFGEVKQYNYDTIKGAGGLQGVLRKALDQCEEATEGRTPFSVVHIKGTSLSNSVVMIRGSYMMSLEQFRQIIYGELTVDINLPQVSLASPED